MTAEYFKNSDQNNNKFEFRPQLNDISNRHICQVFLLRQIWIVNYYVKCWSDNLSNEKKHWCFQRNDILEIVHFGILSHILSLNIYLDYWQKTGTENQQLFDGTKGLDYLVTMYFPIYQHQIIFSVCFCHRNIFFCSSISRALFDLESRVN